MNSIKSYIFIVFTIILSKISGLIRDITIARYFGVGFSTDSVLISFRIINIFKNILIEEIFCQAFYLTILDYKSSKDNKFTRNFISMMYGIILIISAILFIIILLIPEIIVKFVVPGFIGKIEKFKLTVFLLKLISPYILISSFSSLNNIILNTWNKFFISYLIPIILNLSIVFSIMFISNHLNKKIISIGVGVILGGLAQILFQIFYLKKINMTTFPIISFKHDGIHKILKIMKFTTAESIINQLSSYANIILISFLENGSVSWIYYSSRITEIPTGILNILLNIFFKSKIDINLTNKNYCKSESFIFHGVKLCFLFSLPCTVIFICLSEQIISFLFEYRSFNNHDMKMIEKSLILYSIGIISFVLTKSLNFVLHLKNKIKDSIRLLIFITIISQIMNYYFIQKFQYIGLILSIIISSYLRTLLLFCKLKKEKILKLSLNFCIFVFKVIFSSFFMYITMSFLKKNVLEIIFCSSLRKEIFEIPITITVGLIVYFSSLSVFRISFKKLLKFIL
ncbi:hypothetical protein AOQ88_01745 [Candidatus Riesia sp. GBBU]|nr:hypothetical protein AOQ88_01745 [Candidatus Riesia sp. GBBU]